MKYSALKTFLAARQKPRLRMTFEEVAKAAGMQLPASAYRHPSWWANDPKHHAQARAWTDAGFFTENVDVEARSVEFVRVEAVGQGVQEMPVAFDSQLGSPVKMHPMIGAMKGTFTIAPGWDLTKPALDEDELAEWEASLDRKADLIEERLRGKE